MSTTRTTDESSIINKLDSVVPAPLANFDAFPKLPSTYKARSESRGFMTLFVAFLGFLLVLNDVGEYIWGWPDQEFSIDNNKSPYMGINIDITVNMPCKYLSLDLRDAVGDRLMLTGTTRRDGTLFDISHAKDFEAHTDTLSVSQAIKQSRKSRGLFSWLSKKTSDGWRPTPQHSAAGTSCRIWGSLAVKRVTANLHITTLGHGYASYEHVDHRQMNLSHVINEFSFGPYFPDMTQPLDYTYQVTNEPFIAYQYFLHVVPTTYIPPRSWALHTNQYSVTHYTRVLEHNRGTPGIFFKFDIDPLHITIHQRTTNIIALFIRCVGVLGGLFVCAGYAIRVTTRAVEVVTGADQANGLVAAESSGVKVGLRSKWGGTDLRSRKTSGKMVRQGAGWVMEGGESPYSSYAGTPVSGNGFPGSPFTPSPFTPSPYSAGVSAPLSGAPSQGLGIPQSAFGPSPFPSSPSPANGNGMSSPVPPPMGSRQTSNSSNLSVNSPYTPHTGSLAAQQITSPGLGGVGAVPPSPAPPGTPGVGYATYPASPNPNGNGFSVGPPPRRHQSNGSVNSGKKDD